MIADIGTFAHRLRNLKKPTEYQVKYLRGFYSLEKYQQSMELELYNAIYNEINSKRRKNFFGVGAYAELRFCVLEKKAEHGI